MIPAKSCSGSSRTCRANTYVNVMDQYYPAHKAETEPRFAEINRGISSDELCSALEVARAAGLWRFDTRWRHVVPHGAPAWLPSPRAREQAKTRAQSFVIP